MQKGEYVTLKCSSEHEWQAKAPATGMARQEFPEGPGYYASYDPPKDCPVCGRKGSPKR